MKARTLSTTDCTQMYIRYFVFQIIIFDFRKTEQKSHIPIEVFEYRNK